MSRTLLLTGAALLIALSPIPVGAGDVQVDGKFVSTVATGTPPLEVSSTTMVENLNAEFLDGLSASAFSPAVANVIRVAKTGGHFTSIQAALDSITDAAFDNWYVILVGPGVYTESVTLKNFVSVVGHGAFATRIVAEGPGNVTAVTGALGEVWDLSITARSTDGGDATGFANPSFIVRRVVVEAETSGGGTSIGIDVPSSGNVTLLGTGVSAGGGAVNTGLFMETPANVTVQGGAIRASSFGNSSATNYALRRILVSGSGSLVLDGVSLNANLGETGYGIRSENGNLDIVRSTINAQGSVLAVAVYSLEDTVGIVDSGLRAGGGGTATGLEVVTGLAGLRSSSIVGDTAIDAGAGATIRAAHTQVVGSLSGSGTYQCLGLYDFTFSPVSCPP